MNGYPLSTFTGQRDDSRILHGGDGYYYHLVNNRANCRFSYLRCTRQGSRHQYCPGTAKVLTCRQLLFPLHPHNHSRNFLHPRVVAFRRDINARVKAGDQRAFHEIVQEEGQRYPMMVRAHLPVGLMECRLKQIRRELRPPVPATLGILGACLLQEQYRHLTQCLDAPENMFAGMCGTVADQTLSLVFICDRMRLFMQTRSHLFADGTERKKFKKPLNSQIFSISGVWRFHVIPMMRALMLRRTQAAYIVLFQYMKDLMPNLNPGTISSDFEEAQMNAWKLSFPNSTVQGCLWHYAVAAMQYARGLGLHQLVMDEEVVSSIVRSVCALPMLPSDDIEGALEDLGWEAHESGWMPQLQRFFQYIEDEWIPKVQVLSVHGAVHRTNNVAESANRSLNKEIKVSRPNCFAVIRAFIVVNDRALADLRSLALGIPVGRGRKTSALSNDRRIRNLSTDYANGDITRLQFIHRASRRMQGVFNKIFR